MSWIGIPIDSHRCMRLQDLEITQSLRHRMAASDAAPKANARATSMDTTHALFTDSDADRADVICDRNGQVVLGLCKTCGRAEAELCQPCVPRISDEQLAQQHALDGGPRSAAARALTELWHRRSRGENAVIKRIFHGWKILPA